MVACHRCPNLGDYSSVSGGIDHSNGDTPMQVWRNWQTRWTQTPPEKSVRVRIPQLAPLETTLPIKCSP